MEHRANSCIMLSKIFLNELKSKFSLPFRLAELPDNIKQAHLQIIFLSQYHFSWTSKTHIIYTTYTLGIKKSGYANPCFQPKSSYFSISLFICNKAELIFLLLSGSWGSSTWISHLSAISGVIYSLVNPNSQYTVSSSRVKDKRSLFYIKVI